MTNATTLPAYRTPDGPWSWGVITASAGTGTADVLANAHHAAAPDRSFKEILLSCPVMTLRRRDAISPMWGRPSQSWL